MMDIFTQAYLEAMLWAETDNSDERGGRPLDANYSPEDIDPESLARIERECREFQEKNADLLRDLDPEQCGHDFWLTRRGHGVGFWDRNLGERGERLTEAAHAFGDCFVHADGHRVYVD